MDRAFLAGSRRSIELIPFVSQFSFSSKQNYIQTFFQQAKQTYTMFLTPFVDYALTRPRYPTSRRNYGPFDWSPDTTSLDKLMNQVDNIATGTDSSNGNEFRFSLDLPGVKSEDLNIQVDDGVLKISGARRVYGESSETAIKKRRFSYSMTVDTTEIDTSKMEANLADGVLVITAPKLPKSKPVTVTITTKPHPEQLENETETKKLTIDVSKTESSKPNEAEEQTKDNKEKSDIKKKGKKAQ